MNLSAKQLPAILIGLAIGAGIGWLVMRCLKPGVLPDFESTIGHENTGLLFGAVAGAGISVMLVLFQAARDPNADAPRNFTQINGIGSTLIGKSKSLSDGSYWTTEWFTIAHLPIFPVSRYRVTKLPKRRFTIHEKSPPKAAEVIKVYTIVVLAISALALAVKFLILRLTAP